MGVNTKLKGDKLIVYNNILNETYNYYSDYYSIGVYQQGTSGQEQIYNGVFTLVNNDIYEDENNKYYDNHSFYYQQMYMLDEGE